MVNFELPFHFAVRILLAGRGARPAPSSLQEVKAGVVIGSTVCNSHLLNRLTCIATRQSLTVIGLLRSSFRYIDLASHIPDSRLFKLAAKLGLTALWITDHDMIRDLDRTIQIQVCIHLWFSFQPHRGYRTMHARLALKCLLELRLRYKAGPACVLAHVLSG